MGELYNPFPRLPKNIRQIGDRDDVVKLYVEDYVNTYLKRLYPTGGQDLRVGILLGSTETYEGVPYIFIDGALEMEDVTAAGEKVIFSEAAWKKAYQSIEETFPKRTVQGWFICGAPGCILSPLNYWKQHTQYFGGKNQLMYLNSGIDGEEAAYITSDDGFYRLKGYSVYYERNQMMQDYMILRKDVRRVETGGGDRVIRDFRQRMEGRKIEAASRRGTIKTLGMLCSVLSVAVLAGGVVMFNNYQKMREMETVLVSVLPSGVKGLENYIGREDDDNLVVEQIKGKVYPTEKSAEEAKTGQSVLNSGESVEKTAIPGSETAGEMQPESEARETAGQEPASAQSRAQAEGQTQADGQNGAADLTGAQTDGQAQTGGQAQTDGQAQTGGQAQTDGQAQTGGQAKTDGQASGAKPENGGGSASSQSGGTGSGESGQNGSGGNSTAIKDYPVTNMKPGKTYIIGDGETLYGICFKLYNNLNYLEDICALNNLDDVNKIIAGQELVLPALEGE